MQHQNPPENNKKPLISERAFGGVKWARTIDLYDVKTGKRMNAAGKICQSGNLLFIDSEDSPIYN